LVGPRPYLPHERGRIGDDLRTILSSRPGMTGFWQVSGRNQLTLEDRVKLEGWYVRNWTPWLDCIVFAKTFRVVLFPESGFRSQVAADAGFVSPEDATGKALSPAAKPRKGWQSTARV
jgi:lipopolysaccharide/colanic/teichoic acid biosynthesis glycosyltransferase